MKVQPMKYATRNGLSIIEVLTAIVVALVGVAGVMILIPFAVDQAKIGFDQETSYRQGANAANEYELKGFGDRQRWVIDAPPIAGRTTRSYMLDPIAVANRAAQGFVAQDTIPPQGAFPFVETSLSAGLPPHDRTIFIENVNMARQVAPFLPFESTLAQHHFTWDDDLQVTDPANPIAGYISADVAPPQQIFDQNNSGALVRRQAMGEMSVRVLVAPDRFTATSVNPGEPYPADPNTGANDTIRETRNYFIVEKTRPRPNPPANTRQPYDRIYQVDHPYPTNPYDPIANPNARIAFSGGTLIFREQAGGTLTHNNLQTANANSTQRAEIRRGDWVALTNITYDYATNRYVQQINFYQVDDATFVDVAPLAPPPFWQVTLRGPDFDFGWAYSAPGVPETPQNYGLFGEFFATGDPLGAVVPSRTYAIHLPDVWAVFEKTYRE